MSDFIETMDSPQAETLWDICGDFGHAEGAVEKIDGGFAFYNGVVNITTLAATDHAGVLWHRTVIKNVSRKKISAHTLFDKFLFDGGEYDIYTQSNSWQNESLGGWQPLVTGVEVRSPSMRTSFGAAPVLALWNRQTQRGRVFHLMADTSWAMHVRRFATGGDKTSVSVEIGVDDRHLDFVLKPDESLALPEIVSFEFKNRLDLDCHKLHAWWNRRYPGGSIPSTYNTWMFRFDKFDADSLLRQVTAAKDLGFEYFVIDAGWFGKKGCWYDLRGDWKESSQGALAGRMAEISKAVRDAGMKFGFWLESESAAPGAKIIKKHPEWFHTYEGKVFYDFGNEEARDAMVEQTVALVKKYHASYIKQDFNQDLDFDPTYRAFADYHAGIAAYLRELRKRIPEIYINGCAGGGLRMDLGRAREFNSFWLSDNQSPYHGLRIVKETMLRLPPRFIERWFVARSLEGIQPNYHGEDSRLFACDDALWADIRTASPSLYEAFFAGGALCASCDLTALSTRDATWLKQRIAEHKKISAFWTKAVGRILVDTPEVTVFQYSDEFFGDVRIFAVTHRTRQNKLTIYPVLDQTNSYRVDGQLRGPNDLADNGIEINIPKNGSATELRLTRVWPTGSVRQPAAWHRPETRRHLGIPSIAVSPVNGRMWSVYYCGKTPGEDLNCYVVLTTSADGGRTWKEVLVADPDEGGPLRTFDSEIWISPDGKLRWTWTERLCRYGGNPDAQYGMHGGYSSTDRLMMATLSAEDEPSELPEPVQIADGVMMCKPFVLSDGTWLFPVAKWQQAPSACFYASTDNGATFTLRGGATIPKEQRLFDEHCGVQLRNGDILTFIRGNWNNGYPLESISHDGGATWETTQHARYNHTCSRIFLMRLKSGNLLLVKNGPFDKDVGRKEMTAFISRDDGKTWEGGLMLDEREGVSYPDGDQRPDDTIVVTYDHDRLNAMDVLFAEFTEEDVLAGKNVSGRLTLRRTIYSRLP